MPRCPRLARWMIVALIGVMTVTGVAYAQPAAPNQPAQPPRAIEPPAALAWLNAIDSADQDRARRSAMTWQAVLDATQPAALPEPGDPPLIKTQGQAATLLIEQADAAIQRGEIFSAIQLLREAEETAPDSVSVVRRLGLAYMASGNQVRGASYLERVLAHDPADSGALVLLSHYHAQREELAHVLGLCAALAGRGDEGRALADQYRADVLGRLGYSSAAADRLSAMLESLDAIQLDALDANAPLDPVVSRELRVAKTLASAMRMKQGDLLLVTGQHQAAEQAYARAEFEQVADGGDLIARRAYLALQLGDPARATEQVVSLLSMTGATVDDASLIGYLMAQGVAGEQLADRLEQAIGERGASLALLAGLAQTQQSRRTIAAVSDWLAKRPADPTLLRQAARLISFDDDRPEDAEPLAGLMLLTVQQMRNQPEQAGRFADALVGEIDALVCMLRALKRQELAPNEDAYRALLIAVAYDHAGHVDSAIQAYQRAVTLEPNLALSARLPMARLLIAANRPEEALAALRGGGVDAGWEHFELTVRAMSAAGDNNEAMALIDAWQAQRGEVVRTRLLRAELIALVGNPRQACDELIGLIRQNPLDERPYAMGLRLIDQHLEDFGNISAAINMRKAFLAMLDQNLPNSPTARIERAFGLYDDPRYAEESETLLLGALADEPDNALAWTMLIVVYDLAGEEEKASQARAQLTRLSPPGLDRAMSSAARAIGDGEMELASQELHRVLKLEQEGVLPGRALTGDDAASLLQLLGSAEPDADLEAYSLAMVKRFPDNALLNNALGYQWAVKGKNLLQAKAMIERALTAGGDNHSVLDSLAWVCYKLGQFEQAQTHQTRAIELLREEQLRRNEQLRSSKAVLYDHMGDILYKKGETASAIRHWQIARAQRLDEEDMMFEPELRTLGDRVDKKINAVRDGQEPPVEPVPGPEAHGPEGHPADLDKAPKAPEAPES